MSWVDVVFAYGAAVDSVARTVLVWGPPVGLAVAGAMWWRLRPTGRRRDVRTPETPVPGHGDRTEDTAPEVPEGGALTCADTSPDMSVDAGPDMSGLTGGDHR
ncbi:hypothetical protein PV341_16150 [Streptomyces sp. PA03-1a]|nr:hypothetical protein [Streptomyces sp. PA03-1a]MDX2813349.1 hypothetical protein [Streptomyces sp. PA03-5A]